MNSDLISRSKAKEEILDWARLITNPKLLGTEDTMHVLDNMEEISDEELKAEAERRGYRLQKKPKYVKFLPCICGCNRREERWSFTEYGVGYKCIKCGLTAPEGWDKESAKRKWNKMIEEKMKDGKSD